MTNIDILKIDTFQTLDETLRFAEGKTTCWGDYSVTISGQEVSWSSIDAKIGQIFSAQGQISTREQAAFRRVIHAVYVRLINESKKDIKIRFILVRLFFWLRENLCCFQATVLSQKSRAEALLKNAVLVNRQTEQEITPYKGVIPTDVWVGHILPFLSTQQLAVMSGVNRSFKKKALRCSIHHLPERSSILGCLPEQCMLYAMLQNKERVRRNLIDGHFTKRDFSFKMPLLTESCYYRMHLQSHYLIYYSDLFIEIIDLINGTKRSLTPDTQIIDPTDVSLKVPLGKCKVQEHEDPRFFYLHGEHHSSLWNIDTLECHYTCRPLRGYALLVQPFGANHSYHHEPVRGKYRRSDGKIWTEKIVEGRRCLVDPKPIKIDPIEVEHFQLEHAIMTEEGYLYYNFHQIILIKGEDGSRIKSDLLATEELLGLKVVNARRFYCQIKRGEESVLQIRDLKTLEVIKEHAGAWCGSLLDSLTTPNNNSRMLHFIIKYSQRQLPPLPGSQNYVVALSSPTTPEVLIIEAETGSLVTRVPFTPALYRGKLEFNCSAINTYQMVDERLVFTFRNYESEPAKEWRIVDPQTGRIIYRHMLYDIGEASVNSTLLLKTHSTYDFINLEDGKPLYRYPYNASKSHIGAPTLYKNGLLIANISQETVEKHELAFSVIDFR